MSAFPARHPGRCHNDCGEWIDRGDLIRMTDDGAVHDDCENVLQAGRCSCGTHVVVMGTVPDPGCPYHGEAAQQLPPACPKCWLHHAGECDR